MSNKYNQKQVKHGNLTHLTSNGYNYENVINTFKKKQHQR